MPDVSTKQPVECPICGDEFDPTVAGGWCTNTECGEWQYTESDTTETESAGSPSVEPDEDGFVSPAQEDDTDTESGGLFEDAGDAGVKTDDDAGVEADDDAGVSDSAVASAAAGDDQVEAETDGAADDGDAAEATDGVVADAVEEDEPAEEAIESVADGIHDNVGDDSTDEIQTTDADDVEADAVEAEAAKADDSADAADADSIDCPDCGVELDADANFCVECGADVSGVSAGEAAVELDACPGCGTDVEPEDNFCVSCGEDLEAHRGGGVDHTDAIDALEASADEGGGARAPESLVLEVEGREIHVDDGDTVGRDIRAALTAAGRSDDEAVRIHREHVRFRRESDSFYVLDLGDNPTELNGQTLQKGDRAPVAPGDELELSGVASITVRAP